MDPSLVLATMLCVLVGLSLGLLGGGGSVLMVPLFVYIAKVPVNEAIAMSLMIVGLSSAVGVVKYFKQGFVNKRLVILFIVPGIFASFLGARAARFVSSELLFFMFGGMMLLISLILYKKSSAGIPSDGPVICRPNLVLSVMVGSVIGFLTGLLGVGGGFLIVPAIALLMRCSLYTAIGTSLAIIAVNSAAGFAGHLSTVQFDIPLSVVFLTATVSGAFAGTRMSDKFSMNFLQKAFAVLIFLVGTFVVMQYFYYGHGGDL